MVFPAESAARTKDKFAFPLLVDESNKNALAFGAPEQFPPEGNASGAVQPKVTTTILGAVSLVLIFSTAQLL